jgi:hypothetical protein
MRCAAASMSGLKLDVSAIFILLGDRSKRESGTRTQPNTGAVAQLPSSKKRWSAPASGPTMSSDRWTGGNLHVR